MSRRVVGTLLALALMAQTAPGRQNDTWAGQQQRQAWGSANIARSPLRHEWVMIPAGSRSIRAFVTWPAGVKKAPLVLVLHEVFGLTDSTLNTADQVAAMGAITVAPDMVSGMGPHGGDVRSLPSSHETSDMMTGMDDSVVNDALNQVAGWGLKQPRSDGNLAIVGCHGAGARRSAMRPCRGTARRSGRSACSTTWGRPPSRKARWARHRASRRFR